MAEIFPPYLNKEIQVCNKELKKAQKYELKAQKKYEFAVAYTKLCKERLEEAKSHAKD